MNRYTERRRAICAAWHALTKRKNVRPELEVFELGHIELAKQLLAEGLINQPALFQLCLGIKYGAPATSQAMQAMRDRTAAGIALVGVRARPNADADGCSGRAPRRQCARGTRGQPLPRSGCSGDERSIGRASKDDHRTLRGPRAHRAGNSRAARIRTSDMRHGRRAAKTGRVNHGR